MAEKKKKSIFESLQEYNPIDRLSKVLKPAPPDLTDVQKERKRREALMNPARGSTLKPSATVVKKATEKATR